MALFCYSRLVSSSKPKDAKPYQSPSNYVQEDLNIEDIATICGNGHAWRAGIYEKGTGSFSKKNVKANQIIALDFDGITQCPQQVIEYAANIGLPVNFWYPSYSQNPEGLKSASGTLRLKRYLLSNKAPSVAFHYKNGFNFRICWVLERAIKPTEYESLYPVIHGLFSTFTPDTATKDCSRLWYGGSLGVDVLSNEPLKIAALGAISAKEKVKQGTAPNRVMRQKKGFIPDYVEMPEPDSVIVHGDWQEKLLGRCPLFDKWKRGVYLDYNERLALFGNLKYLRHADKNKSILGEVISYFNSETYKGHTCNEKQIRAKFRDSSLRPIPIVKGRLGNPATMPEFFKDNLDLPTLPQQQKTSKDKLDKWMDENVNKFLSSKDKGLSILVSQTGSGKTKRIIDYLLDGKNLSSKKIVYAAPKHSNLIEVEKKMLELASFEQWGMIHRCPEKEVTQQDILYLSMGLPAKTKSAERKGFIDALYSPDTTGVFLMTHSLLTNLSNVPARQIIIDEEIDSSLLKETRLELTNLASIAPYLDLDTSKQLMDFIAQIRDRKREDGIDINLSFLRKKVIPQFENKVDEYLASTSASNLAIGLFDCNKVDGKLSEGKGGGNCIRLIMRSPLIDDAIANNIPVRVLTATPMNKRTEMYFKVSAKVINAPLAANDGQIIQYTGISGAKGKDKSNLPKLANYIKAKLSDETIAKSLLITFKATDEERCFWESQGFALADNEGTQIHLKNNSGLDCFKGKNLIIAGKWDYPHCHYQDIWDDCGDGSQLARQNQSIDLNGVKQTLYLYTQEDMREMQLQTIREATEQAAGRARALREAGATVYLFSNYVISGADEVYD